MASVEIVIRRTSWGEHLYGISGTSARRDGIISEVVANAARSSSLPYFRLTGGGKEEGLIQI